MHARMLLPSQVVVVKLDAAAVAGVDGPSIASCRNLIKAVVRVDLETWSIGSRAIAQSMPVLLVPQRRTAAGHHLGRVSTHEIRALDGLIHDRGHVRACVHLAPYEEPTAATPPRTSARHAGTDGQGWVHGRLRRASTS
ncbi:hypothetical protein ZWY2020_035402 [Hordeum vulgare]|nr:hypothetical protein ZWY2020_035402 [Hordeum vulgare]